MSRKGGGGVGGKGTEVRPCNCRSAFQDKRYGVGRRLHNLRPQTGATCTVCGTKKG